MMYGDLDVKPIALDIKTRSISCWSKLISQEGNKLSASVYQILFHMHKNNILLLQCTYPGVNKELN